ncbi:MAG: CBS domain-containing protein [Acetobacteraceae bacterium]
MTNRQLGEILRHQKPVTLPPGASVREACRRMVEQRVGAILVGGPKGRLLGIFTGRDAVRCLAIAVDPGAMQLRDVMTRDPETMPPGSTAIEALRLMRDGGFRHIPALDQGIPVGVVSRGDFCGSEQDRLDAETGIWERV